MKRLIVILIVVSLTFLPVFTVCSAEDGDDIDRCELYVESNLTRMGYPNVETLSEIAVGDEIEILYESGEPAEVFVDGKPAHRFEGEERQFFFHTVSETGTVKIEVIRNGQTILSHTFTVISSQDMYKKTLREAFTSFDISDVISAYIDSFEGGAQGFPYLNPFLPLAFVMTVCVNFFSTLFAFTRIVR